MENTILKQGWIDDLCQKTLSNINDFIEMLYIQGKSKANLIGIPDTKKIIDDKLIEDYLKKRGYTMNYVLGKRVMIKDFTCVFVGENYAEVWHDKTNSKASVYVSESLLTGLPITLNYMERI